MDFLQQVNDFGAQLAGEIVVLVLGALFIYGRKKVNQGLESLANSSFAKKHKTEFELIDSVTDQVVEFVEKEFTGSKGLEKRDLAIDKALAILEERGIKVSRDHLIVGIENGVDKLHLRQKSDVPTPVVNINNVPAEEKAAE
jgi:Bacteriophage holin of superfamily 6 (Holin_LLH)